MFSKYSCVPSIYIVKKNTVLRKMTRNCQVLPTAAGKCSSRLLDSRWALLKGIGKLLGNAQRLLDTLSTILKGHWKAAGKGPNNTEACWATVPIRRML
jgi:hypothetical protein